eukprot:m.236185 g.236185  ORF g.236185 m.236185 type:complete len:193 (+) comp15263_c0_seq17:282-860(+)
MFEQISGSAALIQEYEQAKKLSEDATKDHRYVQTQKKAIRKERLQYESQKEEAERYQQSQEKCLDLKTTLMLWELAIVYSEMEQVKEQRETAMANFSKQKKRQQAAERAVAGKKKEVAAVRKEQLQVGRRVKKQEKVAQGLRPQHVRLRESMKSIEARDNAEAKKLAELFSPLSFSLFAVLLSTLLTSPLTF